MIELIDPETTVTQQLRLLAHFRRIQLQLARHGLIRESVRYARIAAELQKQLHEERELSVCES